MTRSTRTEVRVRAATVATTVTDVMETAVIARDAVKVVKTAVQASGRAGQIFVKVFLIVAERGWAGVGSAAVLVVRVEMCAFAVSLVMVANSGLGSFRPTKVPNVQQPIIRAFILLNYQQRKCWMWMCESVASIHKFAFEFDKFIFTYKPRC